ncbi:quinate dehydrogenase (quinone) [Roseateles sp. YR242]|uniref:membrane-bound PQQ-dependent dehydrogenase, glucose/quinate/shikimate family n=1 Tax=Roseateles sp. YR242 TaxID=1855305 RepID=UPI0008C3189E|nr:membrane-bound PQQ-dependent dehydrogenase, glucose/quinate/shikimate family [Roseateles sp. YR242]SEK30926.1 quinate dehydrogenase (quinone) [Roseateles sp. YR242]
MIGSRGPAGIRRWLIWLVGLVLLAFGAPMLIGGAYLVTLKGSLYFVLAGLGLLVAAVLIFRSRATGAWVFAVTAAATVVWAVLDVGLVFWPLFSRLFAFGAMALLVAIIYPWLLRSGERVASAAPAAPSASIPPPGSRRGTHVLAIVIAVGLALAFASAFVPHPPIPATGDGPGLTPVPAGAAQKDWAHYGNTVGGSRFVALDQVNRSNVSQLKVAWTYRTGDIAQSDGNGAEDQLTPLQIGGRIYLCTPHNNLIAVDMDTGQELWRHEVNAQSKVWQRCRGLAYFDVNAPLQQPAQAGAPAAQAVSLPTGVNCQRRLLTNTIDARLIAVDADTGQRCQGFGNNGQVDLKAGLGDAPDPFYQLTSPPLMAGTTVVVGGRVADNVQADMPGGVIRGFDVITGAMRWAFDPGNPDDKKAPAQGRSYVRSTPNSWAPMSYDPALNMVFLPMGSASTDLYGVERTPQDHKYGASVLAVDATTGEERWVFQAVRNDLWDFDMPMQPSLIDFPTAEGSRVPAVVIGTKAGQIWVLDRKTGRPLTAVEETPVQPADIPNEPYPKTQPRSVGMPQIGVPLLTESDMWGATPLDQLVCRIAFKKMRYQGLYTAPGTDVSLSFPGSLGGMNWGGISTDPVHDFIFVNDMRLGLWVQMIPQRTTGGPASSGGESVNTGMGAVPLKGTPYAVNKNRFLSPAGIPCQAPPFGTLSAINLKTRQIVWQVPVGTVQDTGPLGIKMHLPMPVGMPTLGGTLSTQGGLVFIAGVQDYYLRAFDSATGKELWKSRLPVGSQGGPISYQSAKTGKQYVLVTAGGGRQSLDRGDYVVAYTLKDD